ncbi:MAG: autotransporter outer membrane beta-barrel domain-containing protein [Proteobacteria bacterium]|nr:autotransporter outer membrane beta-barrel domain-containing protein [Pseudomonadota bacterium]
MPEAGSLAASAFARNLTGRPTRRRRRSLAGTIVVDRPRPSLRAGRAGLISTGASIAVLIALSAGSAQAQQWTGATSNDWTNGANWSGGVVPASPTAVTINSANPAVLGVGGAASGSTGNLFVGDTTSGNLTIENGSTLTSLGSFRIGGGSGTGTVTVTGAGSQWTATGLALSIGGTGRGILNIEDGATVTASGGISLGNTGGVGTLNVSNATIASQSLSVGAGSQVNFDNATYRATRSSGVWIGTGPGTLNIAAGGLTLDSVGFTVSALRQLSGAGALTKTGTGILNLTTSNSYTGRTVIDQGTLALRANGSIAASSGVTVNGTFDISPLTAAGTSIQSLAGSGAVTMGAKNLTITNASDTFAGTLNGTGVLTIAGGKEILSGDNSGFGGSTAVQGGTLAVNGILAGAMDVQAGGRLQGIGTVADTTNAGVIAPGNSIGTLTVAGNYTGNGGTLEIESVLGGDASPTDKLVVTGNTAGTTNVKVINVGGGGAQTVNGIKIIDVGGASNGAFALLGDYVFQGQQAVVGGAYAYTLQKNGIATPADGDWYLRSSLINPPASAPAGPLYQPGVPIYESYGPILLGLNGLPTLRQRVGDGYAAEGGTGGGKSPVWLRVEGQHASVKPSSTTGSTFTSDQATMRGGVDGLLYRNDRGKLIVGVTAHYDTLSSNVKSFYGDGKIKVDGVGLGGTLTWYGDNGLYIDGQSQMTWYRSDLSSDLAGTLKDGNGAFGYAFGAETGRRIPLGGALSLTPQAQIVYSSVDFDTFSDRFGATIASDRADSLQGRAGLSLDHRCAGLDRDGRKVSSDLYAITNLYYEFLDGTAVDVAGTQFTSANDRLWGGIGAGGAYHWANDKYSLYGEVSFNTSLADVGDDYAYKGTLGFRTTW